MTNRASSFSAAPANPALHRYGGRLTAMDELPVHGLGDSFTVDGNGTVTRLPDWPRGVPVFLNFTGTPTFKNSARLQIQGSADYTFAAGDSALLLPQGDCVWSCFILPANQPQPLVAPQGRLTLASGVSVMNASQSAKSSVFYTSYCGDLIPISDGIKMGMRRFSEMTQSTTDATKSPAAVATNSIYDVFVWDDAGTLRCTRGPAWTNSSTRGYTLSLVNGVLVNTSSVTNGPTALRGTWVGTIASNGTSTIDFIYGASASGGVAASFMVWNAYNRARIVTSVNDNGVQYNYSSSTPRQARASAGNQISFILGAQEDGVSGAFSINANLPAVAGAYTQNGVGFDVNNAYSTGGVTNQNPAASSMSITACIPYLWPQPAIGTHTIYPIENANGTNSVAYGTTNVLQSVWLSADLRM